MAERRTDESAVYGHLGDARGEVGAVLAPVVRNPRGRELLQAREGARRQHLGAQWVALQLLEIGLQQDLSAWCAHAPSPRDTHREVPIDAAALGQRLADVAQQTFLPTGNRCMGCCRRCKSFLFEFVRHGDGRRRQADASTEVVGRVAELVGR